MKHIGISSMALWLYLEGEKNPIRGWADANGNIIPKESKQAEFCIGAEILDHDNKEIDLNKLREVKIRSGWDGFTNAYGEIKITEK